MAKKNRVNSMVRLATLDDYEVFKAMYEESAYSFDLKGEYTVDTSLMKKKNIIEMMREKPFCKKEFEEMLKNPKNRIYIYCENEEVYGYCIVRIISKTNCHIMEFAIKPDSICQGHGRTFFNKLLPIIRKTGIKIMDLYCPYPGASRFWKKMGFNPKVIGIYSRRV